VTYWQEAAGNPVLHGLGVLGGNMEGKEVRFGIAASALFSVVTTAASCGAVNAMHDSFTALGGMIPLINIQLGEVVIGGVGAGIYGFLLFALLAVFIAGLMVGRTPEYVGKKIEAKEVKLAVLAIAVLPLCILGLPHSARSFLRGWPGPSTRGRTVSPRSSMPSPRPPATTARRLQASPPARPITTGFCLLRCGSGASS
jgi:K+-transporting ATPase ATPase A chain